jgi:hypothetical protein
VHPRPAAVRGALPGHDQPLHEKGESFGVVCILDGKEVGLAPDGYALIGCEALIRDFKQQDNGLLGIRVEGGRRFRVRDAGVQKDQLLVAEVQWLHEHPEQPLEEEDADLLALLHALAEHPMVASLDMAPTPMDSKPWAISWPICCPLPRPTRSTSCNSMTRNSAWTRSSCCWMSCRASCSPDPRVSLGLVLPGLQIFRGCPDPVA